MAAGFSLKARMYVLLLVNSLIPLLLLWLFITFFVFKAHERQLDMMINAEVEKTGADIVHLMDNMKIISQQITSDPSFRRRLRDSLERGRSDMRFINELIAVFETSNPNVGNITFFLRERDGSGGLVKISSSLAQGSPPEDTPVFSWQNELKYYGPHRTLSIAGDYPVISLQRAVPFLNPFEVYLYIESGYKLLNLKPADLLNTLHTVFVLTHSEGGMVYASDEVFFRRFGPAGTDKPQAAEYRVYARQSGDWQLVAYVPQAAFSRETFHISFGLFFIVILAVSLSMIVLGFIWQSVRHPLAVFEKNLKTVTLNADWTNIHRIKVKEFDENFEYFKRLKGRIVELLDEVRDKERSKAELEIKLLMYKTNPHFIHNTLNTLKWYSATQGSREMEHFISSMNRLLMYNMEKNGETTLQSELDSIGDYIDLQKLKYEIQYTRRIDAPLTVLQSKSPRFMLYPLVENAIVHGLQGKGAIDVAVALAENGNISVKVIDSGASLSDEAIARIMLDIHSDSGKGIGLRYVYRILETIFPGESSFTICRSENKTICEIQMPFHVGEVNANSGF
jgi:sensor histidine kinase YesM